MSANRFRRILVPTDFSPCAEAALQRAIEMGKALQASITLLHAYLPHFYASPPRGFVVDEDELRKLATETDSGLARLLDKHARSGVMLESCAVAGAVPDAILDAARDGYDLIVMGTHGAGGVKELFLGSVAEKVVRRATIPVMTVRS